MISSYPFRHVHHHVLCLFHPFLRRSRPLRPFFIHSRVPNNSLPTRPLQTLPNDFNRLSPARFDRDGFEGCGDCEELPCFEVRRETGAGYAETAEGEGGEEGEEWSLWTAVRVLKG